MNIAREIETDLIEETAQGVADINKEEFESLQKAAYLFLERTQMVSDLYKSAIAKTNLRSKITDLYKNMRDEQSYTQSILKYQHDFEIALNDFLNRTIYLAYVVDDGKINFYNDFNIGEIYKQATANKGRGNISGSKMFDANDLQEDIKEDIYKSMMNKTHVYQEAIRRYRSNKTEEKKNYHISERTFYWWNQYHKKLGGWTDPIVNEGPIAEGYAAAVINQDNDISNSHIENSLKLLWNRHIGKDSIGAAIKGDVVYEDNGNIQFAIKKGSFSTAMVRQYLVLAYNITRLKRLTAEELQNPTVFRRLTNGGLSNIADKIVDAINEKAEMEILEEIGKYKK